MVPRKAKAMLQRKRAQSDFDEEIESHVQLEAAHLMEQGIAPEDARMAALRSFGNVTRAQERFYEYGRWIAWDGFVRDVRFGARQLQRNPGFAVLVVLILSLGIGANSALFGVIRAVLLRPLPYKDPGQLFSVWDQSLVDPTNARLLSAPEFFDLKDNQKSFEGLAAYQPGMANLALAEGAVRLDCTRVTANLFDLLGIRPMLGRGFSDSEDKSGEDQVVVLSYGLWSSRFGSDKKVLGKSIRLNGESHTIVGVMPAGFDYPFSTTGLWKPLVMGDRTEAVRGAHSLFTLARLKPGFSAKAAEQDLARVRRDITHEQPGIYPSPSVEMFGLRSLLEGSVGPVRRPLTILMAGAFLILLLACINVSNLLLAKGSVRQKEMALRLALGAGAGHIFRQLLAEGSLFSLMGGAGGLLMAQVALRAIIFLAPAGIPRIAEARIDRLTLLCALASCIFVSVSISLLPMIQVFRSRLAQTFDSLKERTEIRALPRLREALAAGQIAASLMLLVSAGLLLQSFMNLLHADLGFRTTQILTFKVFPPATDYPESGQVDEFYRSLFEKIQALPGVESAGGVSNVPLYDEWNSVSVAIKGFPGPSGEIDRTVDAGPRYVRSRYFETMGIRLLAGRFIGETDCRDCRRVAVLDESFARRFWPNTGEAIGHQVNLTSEGIWRTVVGVVQGVKHYGPGVDSQPEIYLPQSQSVQRGMFFAVRTSVPPENLSGAIRTCVAQTDAAIPVYNLATQESRFDGLMQRPRFIGFLLTSFAVLALTLAVAGAFGVVSFSMRQRTREFGIRFALGAQKHDVMRLVLGQGVRMVTWGLFLGIGAAIATTRLITSLLYGVNPLNPATFASAAFLVGFVTLLGCAWPALMAARIHPSDALRYE